MTRARRAASIVAALIVLLAVGYAGWISSRSPQLLAKEDSSAVWIALLKGVSGRVVYLGSDENFAYFRFGWFNSSYYKVRACAVRLPEGFPIGSGEPYEVRFQTQPGNKLDFSHSCTQYDGHGLGVVIRVEQR